jgi:hypothetical protein
MTDALARLIALEQRVWRLHQTTQAEDLRSRRVVQALALTRDWNDTDAAPIVFHPTSGTLTCEDPALSGVTDAGTPHRTLLTSTTTAGAPNILGHEQWQFSMETTLGTFTHILTLVSGVYSLETDYNQVAAPPPNSAWNSTGHNVAVITWAAPVIGSTSMTFSTPSGGTAIYGSGSPTVTIHA